MECRHGPCLEHCYKKISPNNKLFYLFIGLLFGLIIMYFKNKTHNKHHYRSHHNYPKIIKLNNLQKW